MTVMFCATKGTDKGTGLGLWMVKRAVEVEHKGKIWFETGDTGTTFHIELPVDKPVDLPPEMCH